MSFKYFRFNLFMFLINILEMMFRNFIIIGMSYYHIIIITRTALDGFAVTNAKSGATSTEKYFVIKRTLFTLKKKFVTTSSRERYLEDKYL